MQGKDELIIANCRTDKPASIEKGAPYRPAPSKKDSANPKSPPPIACQLKELASSFIVIIVP